MSHKISIIVASFNYEEYIKETIESILNQTYQNWEMIVVDDGSQDKSVEVIKSYCEKDERIKLFTHPNNENRGLKETIQLALSKATGEYVAFCESDDTLREDSLEKRVNILKEYPNITLIFSDVNFFGNKDVIEKYEKVINVGFKSLRKQKYPSKIPMLNLLMRNIIPTFSIVMVKKDDFTKCDFDSPIKHALDYYLWWQLLDKQVYYIDEKLTNWRMHSDSYSKGEKIPLMDYYHFRKKLLLIRFHNIFIVYSILLPFYVFLNIRKYSRILKNNVIKIFVNKK